MVIDKQEQQASLATKYCWMRTKTGDVLHYYSGIDYPWWEEYHDWEGNHNIIRSYCGVLSLVTLPGILSRVSSTRCEHCCRMLGLENGKGTPFNETHPEELVISG